MNAEDDAFGVAYRREIEARHARIRELEGQVAVLAGKLWALGYEAHVE